MFEDFKTLVDIKDFQAKLVSEFTTRSQIKIFRNKEVQLPKKQPNVNTSGVTEDNKKESKDPKVINYMKEFEKERMPTAKDWENAKELAEGFIKLSNDSNKNSSIFSDKGVEALCREKQVRICGQCLTSNCHTKQVISTRNKMTKKFLADCKGKHLTLGEVPEALKRIEKSL